VATILKTLSYTNPIQSDIQGYGDLDMVREKLYITISALESLVLMLLYSIKKSGVIFPLPHTSSC
jgi:hypothetical protein